MPLSILAKWDFRLICNESIMKRKAIFVVHALQSGMNTDLTSDNVISDTVNSLNVTIMGHN